MCSAKIFLQCNIEKSLILQAFFKSPIPRRNGKTHCRTEMMGLIGAGNNPMVGMTVAVAVAIEEASK